MCRMFDVIIPVRSTPLNLFRSCLESVLAQDYQDFQVFVCDATPETWVRWEAHQALLQEFADAFGDRWNYHVQTAEFQGVSGARNQIIAAGSSPWVAFIDSDDRWSSNYLAEMAQAMQTGEAEIWVTEILNDVASSHLLPLERVGVAATIGMEKRLHCRLQCYELITFLPVSFHPQFWMTAAVFFSGLVCDRRCLESEQFSEDFALGEDTELMLRWTKAGYITRFLATSEAMVLKSTWEGQLGSHMTNPEIMEPIGALFAERHSDCYLTPEWRRAKPLSTLRLFERFANQESARNRYQLVDSVTINIMTEEDYELSLL